MANKVSLKGVSKIYKTGSSEFKALDNVDLDIEAGKFVVILGPSGAGKSTLLNLIGGMDTPTAGQVIVNGEDITHFSDDQLSDFRARSIGFIFQFYNILPSLTVRENVEVGAFLSKNPLDTDELLKTLGLYEHRHKLPTQLSGGQQQRTAIGRAVIKNPDILLCDEPTGALDYNTSKEILALLERVNKQYGNTVIMVTHNDALKNMADRVVKLRDGRIRSDKLNEQKLPVEEIEW